MQGTGIHAQRAPLAGHDSHPQPGLHAGQAGPGIVRATMTTAPALLRGLRPAPGRFVQGLAHVGADRAPPAG